MNKSISLEVQERKIDSNSKLIKFIIDIKLADEMALLSPKKEARLNIDPEDARKDLQLT